MVSGEGGGGTNSGSCTFRAQNAAIKDVLGGTIAVIVLPVSTAADGSWMACGKQRCFNPPSPSIITGGRGHAGFVGFVLTHIESERVRQKEREKGREREALLVFFQKC